MSFVKTQLIQFIVMTIMGICFNPMNMLAYKFKHLYFSLTLFYGGLLMASNMIWGHEFIHYFSHGQFNWKLFIFGLCLSGLLVIIMRKQYLVNDNQWLKRMISHHSTALTTSTIIEKKSENKELKKLASNIVDTQNKEIQLMTNMIE